jgi:hypothetical protein
MTLHREGAEAAGTDRLLPFPRTTPESRIHAARLRTSFHPFWEAGDWLTRS